MRRFSTRMHSSRMRTDHGSIHLGGGESDPPPDHTPPVDRVTRACENITFPASVRYAVGNK